MKHHCIIFSAALLLLASTAIAQEYRGAHLGIVVSNAGGREQLLVAGVREGATSGIDNNLEEAELPPLPPAEVFDARFVSTPAQSDIGLGSWKDYRAIASTSAPFNQRYTLSYQAGEGMSGVKLVWDVPYPGRIQKVTIDGTDMKDKTELVTQFMQGQLIIEITFSMSPLVFTAAPSSITFNANNKDPLPYADIIVTPGGDPDAAWSAVTDVPWLFLAPDRGNGTGTIRAAVLSSGLDKGSFTGKITISSPVYGAKLDIPVTLNVTLGAGDAPAAPRALLIGNHPNPFTASTVISFDLAAPATDAQLKIHDLLGREVADLSSRVQRSAGVQRVRFEATDLPAGIYLCRLTAGGRTFTRTMTLVR
jgi:hypothetical protein